MRKVRTNFDKSRWTKEELQQLHELAKLHNAITIAQMMGRSYPSVRAKMAREKLDVVKGQNWNPWSIKEIDFLWDNHKNMTAAEMAKHLDRSEQSVKKKCWAIGAPLEKKLYSDEDVRLCRALFAEGVSRKDIAEKLEVPYLRVITWLLGRSRKNA